MRFRPRRSHRHQQLRRFQPPQRHRLHHRFDNLHYLLLQHRHYFLGMERRLVYFLSQQSLRFHQKLSHRRQSRHLSRLMLVSHPLLHRHRLQQK